MQNKNSRTRIYEYKKLQLLKKKLCINVVDR